MDLWIHRSVCLLVDDGEDLLSVLLGRVQETLRSTIVDVTAYGGVGLTNG
jgi:hypothetical protein